MPASGHGATQHSQTTFQGTLHVRTLRSLSNCRQCIRDVRLDCMLVFALVILDLQSSCVETYSEAQAVATICIGCNNADFNRIEEAPPPDVPDPCSDTASCGARPLLPHHRHALECPLRHPPQPRQLMMPACSFRQLLGSCAAAVCSTLEVRAVCVV